MGFRPDELRDFHGRWTAGGGGGHHDHKAKAVLDILQYSSKDRPRTHRDIVRAVRDRHNGPGPFTDSQDVGQTVADLQKQGAIKSKWMSDRKAWGYYMPQAKAKAAPSKGPTKVAATTAAPKPPTKVAAPASTEGHSKFEIVSRSGGPNTISGLSLDHAVREHYGPDAEIRDIGGQKYIFKNGRMVARIKQSGEKRFHGPQDYLNH